MKEEEEEKKNSIATAATSYILLPVFVSAHYGLPFPLWRETKRWKRRDKKSFES